MISIPVAASKARMLRPSRPIIRPFISSFSIWNTVTEFSTAYSEATRWMVWITMRLASLFAVILASSIISLMDDMASVRASALSDSINWFLASSTESPEIETNCSTCCLCMRSNSSCFFSTSSIWAFRLVLITSTSLILRFCSSMRWEISVSFCFNLFSAARILLFFSLISLSCSVLSCKNFSFAWRILSFLIISASTSASRIIRLLLLLSPSFTNI